jgi:hypothetical protein
VCVCVGIWLRPIWIYVCELIEFESVVALAYVMLCVKFLNGGGELLLDLITVVCRL